MNRDFESQFYLFSKSYEFNRRLKMEIDNEQQYFKEMSLKEIDNDIDIKLSFKHYILARYLDSLL